MKQFVAITDEMFYNNPQLFEQLVPFSHNIDCHHLLQQPMPQEIGPLDVNVTVKDAEVSPCQPH